MEEQGEGGQGRYEKGEFTLKAGGGGDDCPTSSLSCGSFVSMADTPWQEKQLTGKVSDGGIALRHTIRH